MFKAGDKIVYPMYGAGIIEDIEKVETEEGCQNYYVIHIPNGNLKIRVASKKAETLGLREVNNEEKVTKTIQSISQIPIVTPDNWNQRYKENMEKIKTGKLAEVAEVVRNLSVREREKGLSGAEKKMLNSARQIIISEIVYSYEIEKEKAEELLAKSLFH